MHRNVQYQKFCMNSSDLDCELVGSSRKETNARREEERVCEVVGAQRMSIKQVRKDESQERRERIGKGRGKRFCVDAINSFSCL